MASHSHYSPLESPDSIRLLTIQPDYLRRRDPTIGSYLSNETISCTIQHFRLEDAPPYYALSYEWGDTITTLIHLNSMPMGVRNNLFTALSQFRVDALVDNEGYNKPVNSRWTTKWLWIDALCIDQENITERSHQVRLMGQIYKDAIEVLVWLGDRSSDSIHHVLRTIENFGNNPSFSFGESLCARYNKNAMIHFFGLTYWQRMWIVQEIGLAKNLTLILGSVSARWESLHVLLQLIDGFSHWRLSSNRKDILASQAARLDFHRSEIRRNTLESLIESCEKCICSDPKDKVYSLVGLADDCQDNELLVDYSKSLFDVYSDVLDFYIRSRDCEDRPSRHLVRFSHILQKSFDRYSEICEGAQTYLYSLEVRVPTPFVQVLGIETNQVLELGPILDSTCLLNLMRESPEDFPHCKTTVSNVVRNIEKLVSFMGSASYAVGPTKSVPTSLEKPSTTSVKSSIHVSTSDSKTPRCRAFHLRDGQVGYGTIDILPGDVICQFPRCDMVVALRRRNSDFDLIGNIIKSKSEDERKGGMVYGTKGYKHPVPDGCETFNGKPAETMILFLDRITLQQLTA